MGLYVNPANMPKDAWLKLVAVKSTFTQPNWNDIPHDEGVVCLVDNGPFTAAAICYSESELHAFGDPNDYRPKTWYFVKRPDLIAVCPEYDAYMYKSNQ